MPKDTLYFELLDACAETGCPICRLSLESVQRHLDGALYEFVNDIEARAVLRVARGYCNDHAWDVRSAFFAGSQFNYWGSLLVAAGWIGVVMLVCQRPGWGRAKMTLASVGQMALSCYLLQTIICTFIFYGHGLGLYGSVSAFPIPFDQRYLQDQIVHFATGDSVAPPGLGS